MSQYPTITILLTEADDVPSSRERFVARRRQNMGNRIHTAVNSIPDELREQQRLEDEVNERLRQAFVDAERVLRPHALKLRPATVEYVSTTPLIDVIYFESHPSDDHYELVRSFVREHSVEIRRVVDDLIKHLDAIEVWANDQQWPAGVNNWSKYTRYSYVVHHVQMGIIPAVTKLISEL